MKYLALDVETANSDYSSICQLGIAMFDNGSLIGTWSTLINPEEHFDAFNTWLNGISSEDVINSPTFSEIYRELSDIVSNNVVVHHMPFDRIALSRVCEKYNKPPLIPIWLDSAKVARRTWSKLECGGYGLSDLASFLEIRFVHHDALEDAIIAGEIVSKASVHSDLSLVGWVERVKKPVNIYQGGSTTIKLDGNPDGPLYGENLVFTGTLSLTRADAGSIAANLGCNVSNSVTKKTTILVVGIQDHERLAGYDKSLKHRKAEELIRKGLSIKILSESDFQAMMDL